MFLIAILKLHDSHYMYVLYETGPLPRAKRITNQNRDVMYVQVRAEEEQHGILTVFFRCNQI